MERLHPEWPIIGACIILLYLSADFHFHKLPFFVKKDVENGADLAFYGSKVWLEAAAALDEILHLSYWKRMWIVQEIVLGNCKNVQYGVHIIPLTTIVLAQANFNKHYSTCCSKWGANSPSEFHTWWYQFKDGFKRIDQIFQLKIHYEESTQNITIGNILLKLFGKQKATDPRDYVYGLLGLVSKPERRNISPDYTLNTTDVFARAAITIMQEQGSLDLLRLNDIGHTEQFSLPFWIPDWSCPAAYSPNSYPFWLFSASRHLPAFFVMTKNGSLRVMTLKVDTVKETGPVRTWKWERAQKLVEVLRSWRQLAGLIDEPVGQKSSSKRVSEDAFWRTVFADSIDNAVSDGPRRASNEDVFRIQQWWHWLEQESMASMAAEWHMLKWKCQDGEIFQTFSDRTESRKFFTTENGRIGTGTYTLKKTDANTVMPGDEIHIVFGCSVPLVLRPEDAPSRSKCASSAGDGKGKTLLSPTAAPVEEDERLPYHHLVGTCYVHGITDGEMLDDLNSSLDAAQAVDLH